MKNELIPKHHSSLEVSEDIADTLHWKLEALKKEERLPEEGIADYIGFTLENLKQSINSKKFYIEELKKLVRVDEVQIERIKTDGVTFLERMGVDRLSGHIVSSVTITKAKPGQIRQKQKLRYLVPLEEIEETLIALGKAEYETVTMTSDPIPQKLRVTQRRVKTVEIVEPTHDK